MKIKHILLATLISICNSSLYSFDLEDARSAISRFCDNDKSFNYDNAVGIFNRISNDIKGLSSEDGFIKLSMIIVPFCLVASMFTTPDKVGKMINGSTDSLANYVYDISSAIGKVQGARDFGNSAGRQQMANRYMHDMGIRRAIR